ncbi:MAG: phosphatase PAP2 family protein [Candidatus Lokiarchaeota archaeon]|nr:phosphatase PAP2 family protein [Candidatus Lokiarchaeota archaeon]
MNAQSTSRNLINKIEEWDQKVFLSLYKSGFSKKIKQAAKIYSFFGNYYFWGILWFSLAIYGYITKEYSLFVLLTGGFIQSMSLHMFIRYKIVNRNRPFITLKNHGVKQHDRSIRENKSFPSGHVTFIMFFGLLFSFYFQSDLILIIFIGADIIMAISRIILGVHYPLDTIFGFVFGFVFYYLFVGLTYVYWVEICYGLGEFFSPKIYYWSYYFSNWLKTIF